MAFCAVWGLGVGAMMVGVSVVVGDSGAVANDSGGVEVNSGLKIELTSSGRAMLSAWSKGDCSGDAGAAAIFDWAAIFDGCDVSDDERLCSVAPWMVVVMKKDESKSRKEVILYATASSRYSGDTFSAPRKAAMYVLGAHTDVDGVLGAELCSVQIVLVVYDALYTCKMVDSTSRSTTETR